MAVTSPEYVPQTPSAPEGPPPKLTRTGIIIAATAGVAVLLIAAAAISAALLIPPSEGKASSTPATQSKTFTTTGTLLLAASTSVLNLDDVNCEGMGGYSDIRSGAQLVITDQSGTIVATASLATGKLIGSGYTRQCQFSFTAKDVPKGHSFYGVQLGRRGSMQYSEAQLSSGPSLQLGS